MSKSKTEFLKKCQEASGKNTKETMARARLKWFEGKPAAAEDGFGALAISDDMTISFPSDAIKAVEAGEREGTSRIGLDPESSVLVRAQSVVELSGCDCSGGDGSNPGTGGGPVSYRYDLNKVVGFEIDPNISVVTPTVPGYQDPCITKSNETFDKCMKFGGRSFGECFVAGLLVENQCRRQFF